MQLNLIGAVQLSHQLGRISAESFGCGIFFKSEAPRSMKNRMKNKMPLPRSIVTCVGADFCVKLFVAFVVLFQTAVAQFMGSEDFSGAIGQDKWFPFTKGVGSISLSNQKFNFTSSSSTGEHEAGLAWINTPVRNSEDWEFQLDVGNALSVSNSSRYAGLGIYVANLNDENDLAYLEFYSTYFDELERSVHGFTSGLNNNGSGLHEGDTFELPFDIGALRAKYDSSERSLTFYFHTGSTADGYFWQFLAKYGLDGSDGTEANANWFMPLNAEFDVGLYGTVIGTRSAVGQLTADNFTTDRPLVGVHKVDFELEASVNATDDSIALSWFSFEGLDYVVQVSRDLETWSKVATVSGTGAYAGLEVPFTLSEKPAFYRIYSRIP